MPSSNSVPSNAGTDGGRLADPALSPVHWKAAYEHVPLMICVLDTNWAVLYANPPFMAFAGASEDDMMRGRLSHVLGRIQTGDDARGCGSGENGPSCTLRLALEDTFTTGAGHRDVAFHTTGGHDGERREISLLGSTSRIDAKHFLLCLTDISEPQRVEDALRKSEARFRNLLQDLPSVAVQGYGPDGTTQFWNRSSEKLYGHSAQEALGRNLVDLIIPPEMRGAVENAIRQMIQTGQPIPACELSLRRKDGSRVPVFSSHVMLQIPGRPPELFCIDIDLSERKKAQAALRIKNLVFDASLTANSIADLSGIITEANDAFLRTWGYRDKSEVIGQPIRNFLHNEDETSVIIAALVETGRWEGNYTARRKDGSTFFAHSLATAVLDENGRTIGYQSAVEDITDQKRTEDQTRLLQKSESLGRMAGAIAHHFNNQLQAVIGYVELAVNQLGAREGTEEVAEFLTNAMRSSRKAAEVSGQMLTYLGQTQSRAEALDLSEICQSGLCLLQAAIPKSTPIETDLPTPGPSICASGSHIQQVLTNLMTNAWEAGTGGLNRIRVATRVVAAADIPASLRFPVNFRPQGDTYACLEVADAGGGIAPSNIDKLFDPFFSTKFAGRGLGLPVVLGIVRSYDGVITVESSPNRGSTFRVFLPVSTAAVAQKSVRTLDGPKPVVDAAILLVEDEAEVREMTALALRRSGLTVFAARDGVEAVALYREHQSEIGCLLCDLVMPRMDGWETITAIRALRRDLPVILVSGYDETRAVAGSHHAPPQVFLGKPYEIRQLHDAIRKAMGKIA